MPLALFATLLAICGVTGTIPMFGECKYDGTCEAGTACRFEICLPLADPIPVFVYDVQETTAKPPTLPTRVTLAQPRQIQLPSPPMSLPMLVTLPHPQQIQPPEPEELQAASVPPISVHTVIIQPPRDSANAELPSNQCPAGCRPLATCSFGRCYCVPISVVHGSDIRCSSFSQFRSQPTKSIPVQAVPGDKCGPNVECTGGSLCQRNICECPSELQANGEVCVSPAEFGLPHRGLPGYH